MKLLAKKKRKIAILFTSGLGDTLMFVPLLKHLKHKEFTITCIFYSAHTNDCLFDPSLVDSKIFIRSKFSLLFYALSRFRHFSNFYINQFGNGRTIRSAAFICSKKITKTTITSTSGAFSKRRKAVVPNFTDAEQNLRLLYTEQNAAIKNIEEFYLPRPLVKSSSGHGLQNNGSTGYFMIQVSAGNNMTPFKNWPIKNWLILIERLCRSFPHLEFIIAGDRTETAYARDFENLGCSNCRVLIGKTTIEEVFDLTAKSSGYIGLDSGLMHIAVALQKKTLAIFGASNENLYGYEFLDPGNHKVISSTLTCRPCSSWKNANTSRVTNPMLCPDFACLTSIDPGRVFDQTCAHFNLQ